MYLYLLVMSADKFCKQFGPRSSGSKLFDPERTFKKNGFEKNQQTTKIHEKFPRNQSQIRILAFLNATEFKVIAVSKVLTF